MRVKRGRTMQWKGKRLRELRNRYCETQEEFIERLDVSLGTLRFWEQGQGEPLGPAAKLLERIEDDLEREDIQAEIAERRRLRGLNGNGRKVPA